MRRSPMRRILSCGAVLAGFAFAVMSGPAQAETITVTHWGSAFFGAPYAVAMAKGYFKRNGADITGILTSTGGGTTVRNTLASSLPYGEVALSAALEAVLKGEPLVIVNAGAQSVADILWVAKPDSPLHSIKDLVGKKVAYTSPGSLTNMLILMSLKASGTPIDQVHLVPVGGIGANYSAVMSGAVDAAMLQEPVWTVDKSHVKPVFWVKEVLPTAMMETVGVVTRDFAKSHPAEVRAIVAGRSAGVKYIMAHPEDAAPIIAKANNLDPKIADAVVHEFVKEGYWSDGKFDFTAMDRMASGLEIVGKLKGKVDWSKYVDQSFLPKTEQSLLR